MSDLANSGRDVGGERAVQDTGRRHERRPPCAAEIVVNEGVNQLHRRSRAVRGRGPGKPDAVIHFVHPPSVPIAKGQPLPVIAQSVAELPLSERDESEDGLELVRVLGDDEVLPRGECRPRGEGEIHPARQSPAGEVQGVQTSVVDLYEFAGTRAQRGVVVELVDDRGSVRRYRRVPCCRRGELQVIDCGTETADTGVGRAEAKPNAAGTVSRVLETTGLQIDGAGPRPRQMDAAGEDAVIAAQHLDQNAIRGGRGL